MLAVQSTPTTHRPKVSMLDPCGHLGQCILDWHGWGTHRSVWGCCAVGSAELPLGFQGHGRSMGKAVIQ